MGVIGLGLGLRNPCLVFEYFGGPPANQPADGKTQTDKAQNASGDGRENKEQKEKAEKGGSKHLSAAQAQSFIVSIGISISIGVDCCSSLLRYELFICRGVGGYTRRAKAKALRSRGVVSHIPPSS